MRHISSCHALNVLLTEMSVHGNWWPMLRAASIGEGGKTQMFCKSECAELHNCNNAKSMQFLSQYTT